MGRAGLRPWSGILVVTRFLAAILLVLNLLLPVVGMPSAVDGADMAAQGSMRWVSAASDQHAGHDHDYPDGDHAQGDHVHEAVLITRVLRVPPSDSGGRRAAPARDALPPGRLTGIEKPPRA